ncbi:hypothetical protein K1T71_013674 [Dendrolimus kikuchii]|uniref:Uncharacterized protein n=1 Tax=Dendrolimus kikuchii TaxID=765133 RepID=A0ACC1CHH6_9NEOP|nr:hypothetical protein K1T71_013674 [Dendrolimus kikuchii]
MHLRVYNCFSVILLKCLLIIVFEQCSIGNQVKAKARHIMPLGGFFGIGDIEKKNRPALSSATSSDSKEEIVLPSSVKKKKAYKMRSLKKNKTENKRVRVGKKKRKSKKQARSFWTKDINVKTPSKKGRKPVDIIVHIKVNE